MWEVRRRAIISAHWSLFPGVTAQGCCCSRKCKGRRDRLLPKVTAERSPRWPVAPRACLQAGRKEASGRGSCILYPLRTAFTGLMCSLYWQSRPSAVHGNQSRLPVAQSQECSHQTIAENVQVYKNLQRLQNRAATYLWVRPSCL